MLTFIFLGLMPEWESWLGVCLTLKLKTLKENS